MGKWKSCSVLLLVLLSFAVASLSFAGQWRSYYDLGVYAFQEKACDTAERNFLKALEAKPDDEYTNHYLGRVYLETGNYEAAKKQLKKAHSINPDIPGLTFDLAMAHFKTDGYQDAYELFETLITDDEADPLAVYYAGMSLYRRHAFSKALPYLLLAGKKNRSIKASGFYYAGVCYKAMEKNELAREKFNFVINNTASPALARSAGEQLASMDGKTAARKPYTIKATLSIGYDDNVALEPVGSDLFADEGDLFTDLYLSGGYNLVNQGGYRLGAGFSHYQSWHDDLDKYDISGTTLSLYGLKYFYPFAVGIRYTPSFYRIDSDAYLTQNTVSFQVMAIIGEKLLTRITYDYSKNDYDTHKNRDGHTHEINGDLFYSLVKDKADLFTGIGFEETSASGADYEYGRFKVKAGLGFKAPFKIDLDLTGRYEIKSYDNQDSFYGIKREDKRFSGGLTLSRPILYPWLSLSAELLYEKNDSNIIDFEYRRTVSTLSLGAEF